HRHPQGGVGVEGPPDLPELDLHRRRQRVEPVGTVQRDYHDVARNLDLERCPGAPDAVWFHHRPPENLKRYRSPTPLRARAPQRPRRISCHGIPLSLKGSFGSPRTRSPTLFRCTSDVPPPMVSPRLRRNPKTVRSAATSSGWRATPLIPSRSTIADCSRWLCSDDITFSIAGAAPSRPSARARAFAIRTTLFSTYSRATRSACTGS